MLIQGDIQIQRVLSEELRAVKADTALLLDVFTDLPAEDMAVIRRTFETLTVPVKLAYPRDVTELPGLFVVLGASQESDPVVGEAFDETETRPVVAGVSGSPLYWDEHRGTFLQSTFRVCCWTENANLTAWLQNVTTWALLRRRDDLGEAGLQEQRVGAGDFEPMPRWFPSFAYRRDVTLSAKHPAVFATRYRPVKAIQVTEHIDNEVIVVRAGH